MADLFETGVSAPTIAHGSTRRPLADRLRPKSLGEVIGQELVLGPDAPLGMMLSSGSLSSLIFGGQQELVKPQSRGYLRMKLIYILFKSVQYLLVYQT